MSRTIGAWALWAIAAPLLMRYELRTDDTGVEVVCLLVIAAVLGFLHPRRAWLWALLTGPCIPLAHLLFGPRQTVKDALLLAVVTTAIALVGSYGGAVVARVVFRDRAVG